MGRFAFLLPKWGGGDKASPPDREPEADRREKKKEKDEE